MADPTFPHCVPVNVNNMPIVNVSLFHGLVGLPGADAYSHHVDLGDENRSRNSTQQHIARPTSPCNPTRGCSNKGFWQGRQRKSSFLSQAWPRPEINGLNCFTDKSEGRVQGKAE